MDSRNAPVFSVHLPVLDITGLNATDISILYVAYASVSAGLITCKKQSYEGWYFGRRYRIDRSK